MDVTVNSAGKVYVAGASDQALAPLGWRDMVIWRYNSNGTLDTSFDGDGWVTHDDASGGGLSHDQAYGITLDNVGRVLVTGISTGQGGLYYMVVWRYM